MNTLNPKNPDSIVEAVYRSDGRLDIYLTNAEYKLFTMGEPDGRNPDMDIYDDHYFTIPKGTLEIVTNEGDSTSFVWDGHQLIHKEDGTVLLTAPS